MAKDQYFDHPFWRFVTKISAQPSVENILFKLKDYNDLQLNLLLFCCWYAHAGQGRLLKQDLAHLISVTALWHNKITFSLQQLQKRFENSTLSAEIKASFVEGVQLAEWIEQSMLTDVPLKFARASRNPSQKLNDACRNVSLYCRILRLPLDQGLFNLFYQLLASIFPSIDLKETYKTCENLLQEDVEMAAIQGKLAL